MIFVRDRRIRRRRRRGIAQGVGQYVVRIGIARSRAAAEAVAQRLSAALARIGTGEARTLADLIGAARLAAALAAFELAEQRRPVLPGGTALGLARQAAEEGRHLEARAGHDLELAAGADRHADAEDEDRQRLLLVDIEDGDAAADADGARRRGDGDGVGLADLAADQAEHALAGVDGEVAGLGRRIVDELVDGELRVRTDRQRRAVEEHQMGAVVGLRRDQLVGLHVDADAQHALGLGGRLAARIAVGRRGDADLRAGDGRQAGGSAGGQKRGGQQGQARAGKC